MKFAAIGPIAVHYPARIETNAELQRENPNWDMAEIADKTGILQRHIAAASECASDLGVAAAERLFSEFGVDPRSIDYLLLCTQTPDYPLPTTACLMQDRLGLRTDIGALDFNLGCSGFVYGLSLADGLIRSGVAGRCLLVTAETYSKYIHPADRSLRTIFGDAAAATLIEPIDAPSMGAFEFGTDGRGGDTLLVTGRGLRPIEDSLQPRGRKRWASDLYMDGPSLMRFAVGSIPEIVDRILAKAGQGRDDVDLYLMHQATLKMLQQLRLVLEVDAARLPVHLAEMGNTVSSTLPILIEHLRRRRELTPGTRR